MADNTEQTNEDTGEALGSGNDARIALLNQIADGNDTSRSDELRSINDDETTEEFKVEGAEEKPEPTETQDTEPPAEVQPEPVKRKIKVNGREIELTEDEIIARVQKVEAADEYLAEAARLRNEAMRANAQPTQPPANADAAPLADDEIALARAIQMGSEEDAVAAIRKIRSPVGPSQDDIRRTVTEQLRFDNALSTFKQEFSDIDSDPVLKDFAVRLDKALVEQGDRRPYVERYRDVGTRIRSWMSEKLKAPTNDAALQNKEERKASAPAVPRQAAAKTGTSVVEEKEESTSDVIAAMAAKRGGPQWMQGRG